MGMSRGGGGGGGSVKHLIHTGANFGTLRDIISPFESNEQNLKQMNKKKEIMFPKGVKEVLKLGFT